MEDTLLGAGDRLLEVQIVEKLGQASCNAIVATLPELEYLKGFVCRAM